MIISPFTRPPEIMSTVPSLSTQVWCHLLSPGSQALRLWPRDPLAPSQDSYNAQPPRMCSMRFVPARCPVELVTSQTPIRKSN